MFEVIEKLSNYIAGTALLNGLFLTIFLLIKSGDNKYQRYLSVIILFMTIKIAYILFSPLIETLDYKIFIQKAVLFTWLLTGPLSLKIIKPKLKISYFYLFPLVVFFIPDSLMETTIRFIITQSIFLLFIVISCMVLIKQLKSGELQDEIIKKSSILLFWLFVIWLSVLGKMFVELTVIFSFMVYSIISALTENNKAVEKEKRKKTEANSELWKDFIKQFEEQRCYLIEDITLDKLASKFTIHRNELSRLINDETGVNFSDFINAYRVKEAEMKLINSEYNKFTIAAIAMESGFRNLSTFNIAFKKIYNITPGEYRREKLAVYSDEIVNS